MKLVFRALAAVVMAASMCAPATAAEPKIAGEWQTGTGDLAYRLSLCGDGALCGIMTYSRDPDARLQANVGKQIINHAERVGPQSWKGELIFAGQRLNGTMTLVGDELKIDGCAYLIVCGNFSLFRM